MTTMITLKIAVFGGGCFWCTEAVFKRIKGVMSVTSGYAGGKDPQPTYEEVSSGMTGYAEVIQIEYDPSVISYEKLLSVFFAVHDPTTLNRQGADEGSQYRSVIFYTSEEQKKSAQEAIMKVDNSNLFPRPVVTEIKSLSTFYTAEDYHTNYYDSNRSQPYCRLVIDPKIDHLKEKFADILVTV